MGTREMPVAAQELNETKAVHPETPAAPRPRRAFHFYCLTIALVPALAVAASFFIGRSSWYLRHQRSSYLAISDYSFTLTGQNCEVVIYGDSSALTGVAPHVIEAATRLRACNIAQPNTALAVAGTFALDSYLARNAAPRFLIFQFTAPDFSPLDWTTRLYEEGALQLVRHKLDRQTLALFARHPIESLGFSQFILRTALFARNRTTATYDRAWADVESSHGLFTVPSEPLAACVGPLEVRPPDSAWIRALRARYSRQGTRVFVYVAPYPECDGSFVYYSEKLAHLADNPLQRFPIRLFNEKNHFTREGAEVNTRRIAADIVAALHP